jgi:hypothetical protein
MVCMVFNNMYVYVLINFYVYTCMVFNNMYVRILIYEYIRVYIRGWSEE